MPNFVKQDFCRRGHDMRDPANVHYYSNGRQRCCIQCRRLRDKVYRANLQMKPKVPKQPPTPRQAYMLALYPD